MENEKDVLVLKDKSFRVYRRISLFFVFLVLCVSIWSTMMNNINWRLNDVLFPVISILIIIICGMFGNLKSGFSLFHLRTIKMTRERLVSVLIGLFFPLVFIFYVMVTNDSFMEYIRNISLHNFITLCVFFVPVVIIIAYIIYFGYVVMGPKYKRAKIPEYSETVEKTLDNYKYTTLSLVSSFSIISIWIKVALNINWKFDSITTEIVVLLLIFIISVIANSKNKMPWYYSSKIKFNKYFVLSILIPYLIVIVLGAISNSFRDRLQLIGFYKVVSMLLFLLPIFIVIDLVSYYVLKFCFTNIKPRKPKKELTRKQYLRYENMLISFVLSLISVLLIFIYVITNVLTTLNMEILLQMITIFIPLGVIIYLVYYYSIITINNK